MSGDAEPAQVMTPEDRRAEAISLGMDPDKLDAPRGRDVSLERDEAPPDDDPTPIRAMLGDVMSRLRRHVRPDPEQMTPEEREAAMLAEFGRQIARRCEIVPPRYAGARLEQVDRRIVEWTERHVAGDTSSGLLISGPTGCGKTHAMWAVYREIVHRDPNASVAPWKVIELLDALRPGGDVSIKAVAGVGLLMLDDIGVENPSPWVAERMHGIIDSRYDAMLPTVITTNIPPARMSEVLNARIASRVAETFTVVTFHGAAGTDRRLKP